MWCLFMIFWAAVLGGSYYHLEYQLGVNGWWRFIAQIPLLILLRISVQRFLQKGQSAQEE